jgi:hypothetical protein
MRTLREVALDIRQTWLTVHYSAAPYLAAMETLETLNDYYLWLDSGRSIVLYFLSNARTWRGPDARRIKAELKAMLDSGLPDEGAYIHLPEGH